MFKFLLDTNIAINVINLIKRRPIDALERFNRYAGQICLSGVSQAELIHSVEKSTMPERIFGFLMTLVLD